MDVARLSAVRPVLYAGQWTLASERWLVEADQWTADHWPVIPINTTLFITPVMGPIKRAPSTHLHRTSLSFIPHYTDCFKLHQD